MNASMAMDIPLKQPLDIEFKLNRKLAKQMYLAELKEKAVTNRAQLMTMREMDFEKKMKLEQEKLKKFEKSKQDELELIESLKQKK